MKHYDVIVIGSGGASKITSPAARLGKKVACIEKDALGGTCLNRGCIPSKMLIHPADVAAQIKSARKFDITVDTHFKVDFNRLVTRISDTVDSESAGIVAGYNRNPNIDYYPGAAKFVSDKVVEVNHERLTAPVIVIGVGARPQIPTIPGLAGTPYMTSTDALRRRDLPKKMIVIGASYIAAELGHAYGALGTETHFLVRSRLLRREDRQVSEEFTKVFAQQYPVHIGAVPINVNYQNSQFTVTYQNNGRQDMMTADALLIATGVVSNADTLALENTVIELDDHNFVKVDEYLQTTVDGVYALGDCIGRYFYRHSVNFEGEYLFNLLYGNKTPQPIRYPPVPHAVFSSPQVAGVGKTEEELKAAGVDYVAGVNPYAKSAMGMALLAEHGFCKILIERGSKKILGAHIVGDEASNMIHMIIALMTKDGTLDDLLSMIYIHPALPEIVRNAARKAKEALKQNSSGQDTRNKVQTIDK